MLKFPFDAIVPTPRTDVLQSADAADIQLPSTLRAETAWYKSVDDSEDDPAAFEAAFARLTGVEAPE